MSCDDISKELVIIVQNERFCYEFIDESLIVINQVSIEYNKKSKYSQQCKFSDFRLNLSFSGSNYNYNRKLVITKEYSL